MLSLDSLDSLNPAQREAVTYEGDEHCLILAGAGSGKTRVLTHRIAWLLSQGVPPRSILAITFTNKAASEMRERAIALIGSDDKTGLHLSTFHSFGSQFIRRYAEYIGLTQQFSIYGESDQKALVKSILEERGFLKTSSDSIENEHKQNKALIDETVDAIAKIKEKGILPSEAKAKARFPDEKLTAQVYEIYETRLIDNNAVDFAGLLLWPLRMIQQFSDIRQNTHRRYRHILVDEFQDTNLVQLDLLSALMGEDTKLTAVGDDDQSIYAWRGADPKAILAFSERFGSCAVFKLEQNYRSTKPILHSAANLIDHNVARTEKRLWTDREGGEPVHVVKYEGDRDESWDIVRKIAISHQDREDKWSDYAILYRKNATSLGFETACTERGVPYQVVGGLGFFERAEILDILAYLRILSNPLDTIAFRRAIHKPARNIGEKTAEKLIELIEQKAQFSLSPQEAMFRLFQDIVKGTCKLPRATQKTLNGCRAFYELLVELADWKSMPLRRIVDIIIAKTEYLTYLKAQMAKNAMDFDEALERIDALKSTLNDCDADSVDTEQKLISFLSTTSLIHPESDEESNSIKLMTIHGAKGLEFDTVFIAGVENNVLPLSRGGECDIEEERRLMYVAMTRAKRVLNISYAEMRYEYGRLQSHTPSQFLGEMMRKDDPPGMIDESWGECDAYHGSSYDAKSRSKRPQLAWTKKSPTPSNRKESSFEDEVGGGVAHAFGRNRKEASFEDEVGGGVARTFGRKKGNRSHSDFGSDSEFYEEHCISYDDKSQSSIPKVATPKHATSTQNATTQALDKNDKPISIGDHVRHAIHGVGTVVRIEKASGGHKVAVQFGANDIRTIIARFLLVV